ncbi:MAG: hypothetical protein GM46_7070 [actinobacterium acAcidi]|nr:MAG: hypothetical protein GM46_7070 [actinobacterium acAcidi]
MEPEVTHDEIDFDAQNEDVTNIKVNRFELNAAYWKKLSTIIAVAGPTIFLLLALHPNLILRNNIPTGGDMGAHVWAPAYLRDHLLTNFKLSGWSMDWYSGLPIYRFYMVVPALMIVLLDVVLPYGIAIKIIAVIGILTLPFATWLFGRFAKFAYPLPELFAIAATIFLFDESFTIYGGNIASTMAGEFSFSISLSLAMLGFALLAKGLDTGKHRVSAAIIISLSALSHGIVLLFVFGGAALMLVVWNRRESLQFGAKVIALAVLLSSFWVIPFVTSHAYMTDMKYEPRPSGATDSFWKMFFPLHILLDVSITALAIIGAISLVRSRHKAGTWITLMTLVLAAGVFIARNSLPVIGLLWNPRVLPFFYLLRYFLFAVGLYELAAFALRMKSMSRIARMEAGTPVVLDIAKPRDNFTFNLALLSGFTLFILMAIGFRFQELPFGSTRVNSAGQYEYVWGPLRTKSTNDGFVDGWARWNFTGYEGKSAYGEYYSVVQTMKQLGEDSTQGCGRALWENSGELNKYGTTMALMLLPFWTDGCISSMEGLFFEAAGSTPYHFITAAAMSKQSSNPVRELRYDNNDAAIGVRYLQELGVKYFMGFTPEAIAQASQQEGLTEVARSGPWVVYRVANSDVVTPLATQPVVANISSSNPRERWLEVGTSWFQHPETWTTPIADDGPSEWQRIDVVVDDSLREGEPNSNNRRVDVVKPATALTPVPLEPVVVSNVNIGQESVRFSVDKVGVPVLVRVSYFPNWKVDGAKGPYRVAPNMMVVIPTSTNVNMHYGWTMLDYVAYLLSFAGIAWIVVTRRRSKQTAE